MSDIYNKNIAQYYDNDAFGLDRLCYNKTISLLREVFPKDFSIHAIEIGSGTGNLCKLIYEKLTTSRLVGLELSEHMLAIAAKKVPQATMINADFMNDAGINDLGTFDLVIHQGIYAHMNWQYAIKNSKKYLNSAGVISIYSSTKNSLSELVHIANKFPFTHVGEKKITVPKDIDEVQTYLLTQSFSIIKKELVKIPVTFRNFDDFWSFAYQSAWLLDGAQTTHSEKISYSITKMSVILMQLLIKEARFPLTVTLEFIFILARKNV